MKGRVLVIAGSDSGGGAGIQADIKTVTALGGYAATAVTAITVQDTTQVKAVEPVSPNVIEDQIRIVLEDIGADCIKIGMIGSVAAGEAILHALTPFNIPIILDPVLVATSGDALGGSETADLIKRSFLPRSTVVLPNIPEAEFLAGQTIENIDDMRRAGQELLRTGTKAVLMKGGHLVQDEVTNLLIRDQGELAFSGPRLESRHTHGTGCTLASAVAIYLAQGDGIAEACRKATLYVRAAIQYAPGYGKGHGPLNHALRPTYENGSVIDFQPTY